jgi:hypothetical protein
MVAQVLLLNPSERKGVIVMKAKRSSSGRFTKARARPAARRRRNPASRTRTIVRHVPVAANPRRRRPMARRANPIRHHRRRRNPSGRDFMALATSMLKEAGLGAVGSIVVNAGMSFVKPSLPITMQSGWGYAAIKAAATIGLAVVGKGSKMVRPMMQGALTCQLSQLLISELGTSLPTDGALAGMGYPSPAMQVYGGGGNQLLPRLSGASARRPGVGRFVGAGTLKQFIGPGRLQGFTGR